MLPARGCRVEINHEQTRPARVAYSEASSPILYFHTGGGGFPDAVSLTVKREALTTTKKGV